MAVCSSCGTPVTDLQKFCRGCGAAVRAATVQASAPAERTCGRCGHYVTTDARFCRACGTGFEPSQSQPHVAARHLRQRRSTVVWRIPVIATLSIAVIAGACFLWSRGSSDPIPDATIVKNAVQVRAEIAERERALALERERVVEAQRARVAQAAIHTPPPQAELGSIPRGAETTVRLTRRLRTDALQVEDRFETITIEDIIVSGRVVVPAGATLRGVVAMVEPANRTNRNAKLDLRFDLLTIGTQSFPIRARATRVLTSSGVRSDAVKVGAGAAAGAVIGAILGGGKGAAIGGAIGGGGTLAVTDGREIDLASGSTLRVAFDSAVEFE